ncbi:MAG TPA: enoyl-CoA hydratase-related protein [Candidatus Sulfotelmatobacter sp.]|nr:enoyl-CoA hydratase-related protein [Candidatus Sulfotelmatobacter sp.]
MKPGLEIGDVGELTWVVDPTMTVTIGGVPQATVFSTPNMILLMERSASEALRPFLEDGEESVGVEVQVEHVAAAPLGATVRGVAKVTEIDGRRVGFEVWAYAGDRELGRGRHRRAMVRIDRVVANIVQLLKEENRVMNLKPATGELGKLEAVTMEISNRIATVTLNRPRAANAITVQMTDELERIVAWLAGHPQEVRVVVISGAGDVFCAGDDVKEVADLSLEVARTLSLRQANLCLALEQLPQPVIAAVNGPAFGAGCVVAYSCDWRLASHAARFAMPEIKLGWPPGYGIAQLTALVGKARALQMCLTGEAVTATQALEWGLVNELVPGTMLIKSAHQLAERLLLLPAEALRQTKRLIHLDEGGLPKVTHRADTEAYLRCLELPDAREGISAFVEKRPAKFYGK